MGASKEHVKNPLKVSEVMISSCCGVILTSLFVTPFDVVKTRLQVQAKEKAKVRALCTPYNCLWDDLCFNGRYCSLHSKTYFNGTLDAFRKITKYEGIKSLWSGLSPTLIMHVPASVIYLTSYEKFKELILRNPLIHMEIFEASLISSVSARVIAVTFVCPFEFVRTKRQSEKVTYSVLFQNLRELIRHRGIISLWHGYVPTLMRDAPFSAIYWSIYEQLKLHQGVPSFFKSFLFGAISGTVAATITIPFDVVKTHRQSELGEAHMLKGKHSKSTRVLLIEIYRKGGGKSLFAGLVPRLLKIAPTSAIFMSTFELGKAYFAKKRTNAVINVI